MTLQSQVNTVERASKYEKERKSIMCENRELKEKCENMENDYSTKLKDRNRYFCNAVLGELAGEEVINLSHYGMPTKNAICIGCQWEQDNFTLLTAPGN